MKLLACDIGSTNLKLQVFDVDREQLFPRPTGEARIVSHGQDWLRADRPLEALSKWLAETITLITRNCPDDIEMIGFSTYREGLVGLSPINEIVFAGTNLQPRPIGSLQSASIVTTLAGWMCWKLTGQHYMTSGQQAAGTAYIGRVAHTVPHWATLIAEGQSAEAQDPFPFRAYLGGTDEQLGYLGTGLFDSDGPKLVIATGTFWSISSVAVGPSKYGVRRTQGARPFMSVDSCVLYKWGPMINGLANYHGCGSADELVPARFFGHASSLWFSRGESFAVIRQAAVDDIRTACAIFSPMKGAQIVVYGGGVRSRYARDIIQEACREFELVFMDSDATLNGCSIVGARAINVE